MNEQLKRWAGQGGGIYLDNLTKHYYHRPTIDGKKTFRLLDVRTLTQARELKAKLDSTQTMSQHSLAKDPYAAPPALVGELIEGYQKQDCPRSDNQPREGYQLKLEVNRLAVLKGYWDQRKANEVKPKDCAGYAAHRRGQIRQGCNGGRSIDMELISLTRVFNWAVFMGKLDANPLPQCPRFRDTKKVKHCREYMPKDGAELHSLARALFEDPRSEALGWQCLLEAMTGCRTSEVLRLRWDAKSISEAGYIDGKHLWLNRSKNGVNPWVEIHPALEGVLQALRQWRAWRGLSDCQWFIPGRDKGQPADKTSLTHALGRLGPLIAHAHRTSHGLRAFYVTVRRSMGIADAQIAAEIGDVSGAAIIVSTYGSVPPNWQGGKGMTWDCEEPAWKGLDIPQNMVEINSVFA